MNWNMGIDELKYGCKGSEINFPDQFWDWSQLFYDEISVDSWVKAKLKPRKRKVDEDEEDVGKEPSKVLTNRAFLQESFKK